MSDLPITELPTEKSAGMFDSIKNYAAKNPELTADVLTAGGMTGLGAVMSGISGAVEAPPGYRMEAARRDALMGGLGGLSSFAALKGSQKFFNEGAASNPVAAAAAGLGGYAFSKAISDARYPVLLGLMGRPSWEVLPGEVTQTVREELARQRRREQRKLRKKASSTYFRDALFRTPLQYNNQSSVWQNILSHLSRVHARGADELKGDNFITRWRASLQPPRGISIPQGPQLSGLDHFVYKGADSIDVNQKEASSKLRSLFKLVADPGRSSAMRTWYDLMLKGKPVGFLKALQTAGGVRAENIELLPQLQGMGLGRKALGELMRQTKQPLLSGWQVSPSANKALQRMATVPGRALTQLTDQVTSTPMKRQGGMQLNAPEGTDIFKLTQKQASDLDTLGEAKQLSDVKRYQEKHIKLRQMMLRDPTAWYVDNRQGPMYGVTHRRTKWRFHLPPRVIPPDVMKQAATVGGGYSPERWVARTAGRVLGAPTALLVGHESAPSWLAEEDETAHRAAAQTMAKKFPKELRNTVVRLGGTNTPDDLRRLWGDKDMSSVAKLLLSVPTVQSNLLANIQRGSHYNPLTNAATVYGNVPQITAHELGHAADFNSKGKWQLPYLLSRAPEQYLGLPAGPMTHWMEIAANRNVHKAYKDHPNADQEMAEAWRKLAPAYGTYGAATALGGLALHHRYAADKTNTPAAAAVRKTQELLGRYMSRENAQKWSPLALGLGFAGAGALAGRGVAELRNAIAALRKRFSTEKKKEPRK